MRRIFALAAVLAIAQAAPAAAQTFYSDPLGKAFAQMMLDMPVPIPADWTATRPERKETQP